MANSSILVSFLFISLYCFCQFVSAEEGQIHFICVAGYDKYKYTYGFEAGVFRYCKTLAGPNNPNVIVIAPNIAAYHPSNPIAGHLDHGSISSNNYEETNITYESKDMTTKLFYEILNGNEKAVKGIGKEQVLKSGPHDTVVLIFINVGAHGVMTLTNNQYLFAEDLIPQLEALEAGKKFEKLLIIVDGNNAGSMFDNYVCTDCNIIVWTNTATADELELCHFDEDVNAYTSTCFSFFFLEYLEEIVKNKLYDKLSLLDFYQNVRTKMSFLEGVPNLYGNLKLGLLKLNELFGPLPEIEKSINAQRREPVRE